MKYGFKEPNRKTPRFRHKTLQAINQEFFLKFKKLHPDLLLSRKDIFKILNTFHSLCTNIISETRDGLELPEQLGYIVVGKCKVDEFYSPNITESLKYDAQIEFKNWNSNGWICKVYYSNFAAKYRFKNAKFWGFETSRPLKQKVSKEFTKNHTKYIVADAFQRINKIYREANKILKEKLKFQKENPE